MFCSHIDKKSTKSEGRGESSALVVSEGPELNHEVLPHVPRTKLLAMSELQEAEVSCSYIGHVMWYRQGDLCWTAASSGVHVRQGLPM